MKQEHPVKVLMRPIIPLLERRMEDMLMLAYNEGRKDLEDTYQKNLDAANNETIAVAQLNDQLLSQNNKMRDTIARVKLICDGMEYLNDTLLVIQVQKALEG